MAPTLSALLCFGLVTELWVLALGDTLSRPSLRAEPGLLIPRGKQVSLWCEGPPGADWFSLVKDGANQHTEKSALGGKAEFQIFYMVVYSAGTYRCHYKKQLSWSEDSDPLELVVTGWYAPPSLSALPSSQVTSGYDVTLQCQSEQQINKFVLYKDGEEITQGKAQIHGMGSLANFSIPSVTTAHEGTYLCYTFRSDFPHQWSAPSNALVLRVTDAAPLDYTVGNVVRLLLAWLVLIILGILLTDNWHSSQRHQKAAQGASA